jgi:predicted CopG family antitoxin
MTVKTITVTEDAYNAMKNMKKTYESFSDLFIRLGSRPIKLRDIVGILKHTPEEAEEFRRRVLGARERLNKDLGRHIEDVRSRLKRAH